MDNHKNDTDEKTTNENGFEKTFCEPNGDTDTLPDRCKAFAGSTGCQAMMKGCMNKCKWFPLLPIIMGAFLLILGYYLDPQVTRVLWIIFSGFVICLGFLGLFMMGALKWTCCG